MTLADRIRFLLVTGGGLGLAPIAPGTFGSLGGVALGVGLHAVLPEPWLGVGLLACALVLLGVGCAMTEFTERVFKKKDPGPFVLDEVVGYLLGLAVFVLAFGLVREGEAMGAAAYIWCFFLFRFFDITKLAPARQLERLPGAVGIMLDDVAAGVYTGVVMLVLAYVKLL